MPAGDDFLGSRNINSSADQWAVVSPSDSTNLSKKPKALYFSAAGDVALVGDDAVSVTFTVIAGQTLNVRPSKVKVTGTTVAAGKIIALY
jgi:hypothetical protein